MIDTTKAVVFQIANEEYAIPIENVISIERMENVTPIPHLPSYVKGIVEVRGELIPVIDMENILYNRELAVNDASRLIVLQSAEISFGTLVADAKEIIDLPPDKLKQVGFLTYAKTSYITGVANLDHRLITVLDPAILVESLEGVEDIKDYMKSRN
ncbi:chemotaxis protein CheW [Neobacillus sp. PS3-34]|uniref:chemotaxis protein CheW n=1 Tax=Neobacillus sp. PS3-34 TaxID=3070678 RepID=UPI0027E0DDB5|nr:chemotaxis protein CheW [Neobacillus sp. PS3-34]WML47592.1 chemotaxis protein CheW [Neobacillus sp. PS3-34]